MMVSSDRWKSTVAADHGLFKVIADTTLDNIASHRTLIRAGFRLVGTDAELHHYEVLLEGALPRSHCSGTSWVGGRGRPEQAGLCRADSLAE
jgi:hypothetical protein